LLDVLVSSLRRLPIYTLFPYTTLFRSEALMQMTNLTLTQINNWFINARRRVWRPAVEKKQREKKSPKTQSRRGSFGNISFTNVRSEEHTSELQSRENLVCRLLLEKKKK